MKRERGKGGEREQEREKRAWGRARGRTQMGKEGGRGNTGTSHELNRTANSSTREEGGGGDKVGGEGVRDSRGKVYLFRGVGRGGQIAFTLRYAHIHTHKKNGTQVAFPVKVAFKERWPCPLFVSLL